MKAKTSATNKFKEILGQLENEVCEREKQLIEAQEEAEYLRKIRQQKNEKINKLPNGETISDELREQLIASSLVDDYLPVIVNQDMAYVQTRRSEWGTSGGIGYYDQVHVFYKNQKKMREWQWRDRYSASNDKPWLSVHGIGKTIIKEKDDKMIIEVELLNKQHRNRATIFEFNAKKNSAIKSLSEEEQIVFMATVEKEIARVKLSHLLYHSPPSIKQREIRADYGVAAFIIEEQISQDRQYRQFRHNLYVVHNKKDKAEFVTEDHGWESEGGAFLKIIEINHDSIIINTKGGKKEIKYNNID